MTIRDYIRDNCVIAYGAVIAYFESGRYDTDVDLDFEIDEIDPVDFDTAEEYDKYCTEIEVQKKLAQKLIDDAESVYQCDEDSFIDEVNDHYIYQYLSDDADPNGIFRYFDYDKFKKHLFDDGFFCYNGYYFLGTKS